MQSLSALRWWKCTYSPARDLEIFRGRIKATLLTAADVSQVCLATILPDPQKARMLTDP